MKNSEDLAINRIVNYLNNEMSQEELISFEIWLKNDENHKLFKNYVVANHYVDLKEKHFDEQAPLNSFLTTVKKKEKRNRFQLLKYAALLAGIVFGVSYFLKKDNIVIDENALEVTLELNDGSIQQIAGANKNVIIKNNLGQVIGVQKEGKIVYTEVANTKADFDKDEINTIRIPNGRKFQLVLSDGTEIYLNSGSVLKYPSQFIAGNLRQVELVGEAFFKVAKNRNDAFIVKTNGVATEVFGTEFNVSSYENEDFSEVVLVEGSVGIFYGKERFDKNTDRYLEPNQMAKYEKNTKNIIINTVDVADHIAWVNGVLLFKNESFESIMKKLERHYNVEIDITYEQIKKEKFTGQFDVESIDNVLNTFKLNTSFNFEINENKLTINP